MQIELRHLTTVLTVAEQRSMRKAATALQVSQVALDAKLRRIEQVVGGQLFARSGDTVWPTELGRHFITGAREVLDSFDTLRRRAAQLVGSPAPVEAAEPVRIAVVGAEFVGPLIDAVWAVWPGRRVSVRQGSPGDVLAALSDDAADLAVVVGLEGVVPDSVETRTIGRDVVFCWRGTSPFAEHADELHAHLARAHSSSGD
jgi:DNA-binding transcriptional LysR family regulator